MVNIRHTGIVVRNLKKSLNFYSKLLGFKVVKKMTGEGSYINKVLALKNVRVTMVKIASPDGQLIELLEYHSFLSRQIPRKISDIGISHIALTVDDLDKEYKKLKNKGIDFVSTPQFSPDGYAKVAFCKAPEGTYVELVEVLDG